MGTRADFYVGRDRNAEWLGSIAWDGYPEGIPEPVLAATDEAAYRAAVAAFLAGREDGTTPEMGWPWPWNDSTTTDYAYTFDAGSVWGSNWGQHWRPAREASEEGGVTEADRCDFPDMSGRRDAVALGARSGIIVVTARQPA